MNLTMNVDDKERENEWMCPSVASDDWRRETICRMTVLRTPSSLTELRISVRIWYGRNKFTYVCISTVCSERVSRSYTDCYNPYHIVFFSSTCIMFAASSRRFAYNTINYPSLRFCLWRYLVTPNLPVIVTISGLHYGKELDAYWKKNTKEQNTTCATSQQDGSLIA